MRDVVEECEEAGRTKSLADGLAVALAGADTGAPPGRVAAVASFMVDDGASLIPHPLGAQEEISFVRCSGRTSSPESSTAVAARLAAVRIGVLRRLGDHAVEHLGGRVSGGEPIIRKQLVQATIVDTHTELEAARRRLLVAGHVRAAVVELQDRLSVLDWELARLLGASGFLCDGGARAAYVSRLVASCWTPRRAR